MFPSIRLLRALALTLLGLAPSSLQAALLVYEGYGYALSDNANMTGNAVSGTTTGLTGSYLYNNGGTHGRYDTTGLTFSSNFFGTSGGSAQLVLTNNSYSILGVRLNAGTVTGTIYQSHLFQFTGNAATGAGSGVFTRLSNQHAVTDTERFAVMSESKASGTAAGIDYSSSVSSGDTTALAVGSTYLMVSRFTNVGADTATSTGVASLWIFTSAAYDNWFNNGGLESALSTYATYTASDTSTTGTWTFNNNSYFQLAATSTGTGNGTSTSNFDEVRFGTSLSDVMRVPEPSVMGFVIAALGLGAMRRRR